MGVRIKAERKAKGWSQAKLAEKVGISRVHLANIESADDAAHHRTPSLALLDRIAKALRIRLSDLVS
jgi:transcriptional regulator with XRE-family HTH domain